MKRGLKYISLILLLVLLTGCSFADKLKKVSDGPENVNYDEIDISENEEIYSDLSMELQNYFKEKEIKVEPLMLNEIDNKIPMNLIFEATNLLALKVGEDDGFVIALSFPSKLEEGVDLNYEVVEKDNQLIIINLEDEEDIKFIKEVF